MKSTEINISPSIRPHLNEISDRIWAERATVMIGAGFSKNASDGFPDWSQLGDLFYQKAHGKALDPAKKKYLNVLRLAEEVQAAIGRPALENLLRSSIPDLTVEPSSLHVELLELPWVDVFTTNYDTLLERASAKVVTRRYEPVINKEDIPYANKPRIFKLHGSFPSERPFIITEEDYRRYPYDYAPFVNTVQQVLLENTFCLVGFSGDDPNFLKWIGWIRDKLGRDKTQKIYLIGVFDLSSARLQLLAQRGIIVVDLSTCNGIGTHDHKEALCKFFDYIKSKKPEVLNWPYDTEKMIPDSSSDRMEEIQKVTKLWQKRRQAYPGWLVLPYDNRQKLWVSTQSWVNFLPEIKKSPPGLDIQYAFELVWRLEKCLLPVFSNVAELCEKLLEKYLPFPDESTFGEHQICATDKKFQNLPWNDLCNAWFGLTAAMLRYYREEGDLEKWSALESQINSFSNHLSAEQKEFLNYERVLYSLFTLDLPKAKHRIEEWQPNNAQPYWMIKRASTLAEIGQLKEAEISAKEALDNIRKKLNQKVGSSNLALISMESSAMLVVRYIHQVNDLRTHKHERAQFNDRWDELKNYKCDPWKELQLFKLTLKESNDQRAYVTEKREFDIGRVTRTRHFKNIDEEELSAYSFLRFCEEVALPYRLGRYDMAKKPALASLERISRHSSFWATATLARLGAVEAADSLFNRESVNRFTVNEADQLVQGYLNALHKCRDDINSGDTFQNVNYGIRLAQLLPEVISRLCCKCSIEMKYRVLDFIADLYASPVKRNYRNVRNLVKRLLNSMTELEQFRLIPRLLEITYPEDLSDITKTDYLNPLRFVDLDQNPESNLEHPDIESNLIRELLIQAKSDNEDRRSWAITSLVKLHKLELLSSDQTKNLADAIWSNTDKFGLPAGVDFYKFAFLKLPHPDGIKPSERFKEFVKNTPLPIQKRNKKVTVTAGNIPLINEIIGSNNNDDFWDEDEIISILKRMIEWWNSDKNKLRETNKSGAIIVSIPEEFELRFIRLVELLSNVIGPNLNESVSGDIKEELSLLLKGMDEYKLPVLQAKAAFLHIYPECKSEIYDRVHFSLISNNDSKVNDGIKALEKIILDDQYTENKSDEYDPILILSQYITWSKDHSITQALWIIIRILSINKNKFTFKLEEATLKALDKLFSETEYSYENLDLTFDEKLDMRRAAAKLASKLCYHYASSNKPIPSVIEKWRNNSHTPDEFSEIRNVWEDCVRVLS